MTLPPECIAVLPARKSSDCGLLALRHCQLIRCTHHISSAEMRLSTPGARYRAPSSHNVQRPSIAKFTRSRCCVELLASSGSDSVSTGPAAGRAAQPSTGQQAVKTSRPAADWLPKPQRVQLNQGPQNKKKNKKKRKNTMQQPPNLLQKLQQHKEQQPVQGTQQQKTEQPKQQQQQPKQQQQAQHHKQKQGPPAPHSNANATSLKGRHQGQLGGSSPKSKYHTQKPAAKQAAGSGQFGAKPQAAAAAGGGSSSSSSSGAATAATVAAAAAAAAQAVATASKLLAGAGASGSSSSSSSAELHLQPALPSSSFNSSFSSSSSSATALSPRPALPSSSSNSSSSFATALSPRPALPSSSSSNNSITEVAGITYAMPASATLSYKAAGVLVYDFDESRPADVKVLLVREKDEQWSLFAGKYDRVLDVPRSPAATAARELEEETHGLIPATATRQLLQRCPQLYWAGGKMAIYFMRYSGGQVLPDMAAARLAAGLGRPEAAGLDKLAWFSLGQLLTAEAGRTAKDRYDRKAAADAVAAAAALAVARDEAAALAALEQEAAAAVAAAAGSEAAATAAVAEGSEAVAGIEAGAAEGSEPAAAEESEAVSAAGGEAVGAAGDEAVAAEGDEAVAAEGGEAVAAEGSEAVAAEGDEAVAAEGGEAVAAEGSEAVAAAGIEAVAAAGSEAVAAAGDEAVAAAGGEAAAVAGSEAAAAEGSEPAAAGWSEAAAAASVAADSPDPASLPLPSLKLLARTEQQQQQQQLLHSAWEDTGAEQHAEGAAAGAAAIIEAGTAAAAPDDVHDLLAGLLVSAALESAPSVGTAAQPAEPTPKQQQQQHLQAKQEGLPASLQQQQQQQGPVPALKKLQLRRPLAMNSAGIARWLRVLASGRAPAPGLTMQPMGPEACQASSDGENVGGEQQQQWLLQTPIVQETAVSFNHDASKAQASHAAASSSGGVAVNSINPAAAAVQPAGHQVGAAAVTALLPVQGPAAVFGGGMSTGAVGQQPWAISVWSGRYDREQLELELEQHEEGQQHEATKHAMQT